MECNNILLSINPWWGKEIALENKKVEIRKRAPKFDAPFKVFMYCTGIKRLPLVKYVQAHQQTGGDIDAWVGHVFGEFVCDDVSQFEVFSEGKEELVQYWNALHLEQSRLSYMEIAEYVGVNQKGYAWHVSDVCIYDTPKGLSDFIGTDLRLIKKPPQSWCYCVPAPF